ncbi:MAG: DMT family transporter [Promethearchaeota archaeon]|nr:MAG: DMT family transporter [Candidatus Lokiarchaeota archaeon]
MDKDEYFFGYIILIFGVFTWSFAEIIVKLLQGAVGPYSLSFFRFFIGGLFLLLILFFKKDLSGIKKMIKENLPLLIFASCFASGLANIIYFVGVSNTRANIAATIYTTYPIWITVYSFFILNEKSNLKWKFIGIIIGLLGIVILMTNFNLTDLFSTQNLYGNFLVLLGSVIWSLYSVLGKKIQINEKETSNIALKFCMVSSFLACIPVFLLLIFTPEFDNFLQYNFESWFWISFLGIVCTGLGTFLLFEGIKHLEVSKGMSLAFLKPIFATVLAFIILNETPSITLIISIGLVIISILMINKKSSIRKNSSEILDIIS